MGEHLPPLRPLPDDSATAHLGPADGPCPGCGGRIERARELAGLRCLACRAQETTP